MRKTKEEALQTKEMILDTALQIFNEKGYSRTSQEDIVNRLGMTRGAFYWHFKDKEDLLRQLILREHTFIAGIITKPAAGETTERNKLERQILNLVNSFYDIQRYRDYVYLVRFRIEFNSISDYLKNLTGLNEFIIKEVEKILRSAVKKGELAKSTDPAGTAVHLVSLMDGMFRLYFAVPKYLSRKKTAVKIITEYIELIFKK